MMHTEPAQNDGSSPLAQRRILITRAPHQASELADDIRALGGIPVLIPTIEIGPPGSFAALDAALGSLADFDIVAFTSANAVDAFHQRAQLLGLTSAPQRVAVVGPATARAIAAIGLTAALVAPTFTAEALAEALLPEAPGRNFLLVLAELAPPTLQKSLEAGGGNVTVAHAYRNRIPADSRGAIRSLFADPAGYPDAVTFTSASTAANLVALLDAVELKLPASVVRASIGPITSRTLRELGLPPHIEAPQPTVASLTSALAEYFCSTR
jgi:uroporphyrinogen-III synthase